MGERFVAAVALGCLCVLAACGRGDAGQGDGTDLPILTGAGGTPAGATPAADSAAAGAPAAADTAADGGDAAGTGGDGEGSDSGGDGDGAGNVAPGGPDGTSGAAGSTAADTAADGVPASAFPPATDLENNGPFITNGATGTVEGPECIVHRPMTLGEDGLKHPVIIWGMGTGGFNTYGPTFDLWASNGFIVAASVLGNGQGDGVEMLACLDHVCDTYAPDVDCRAGASGHSQGGGGAIMAGTDPRVITTAPIQPYIAEGFGGFAGASITEQTGPMLLLSGTADTIATPALNQQPVFETTNVPVLWANLVGGDHVVTGIDGAAGYKSITLAWFRLQLLGDETYRGMFYAPDCSVCSDSAWQVMPASGL